MKEGQKLASTNPRFVARQLSHLPHLLTSAAVSGALSLQNPKSDQELRKNTSAQVQNVLKFIISQNPLNAGAATGGVGPGSKQQLGRLSIPVGKTLGKSPSKLPPATSESSSSSNSSTSATKSVQQSSVVQPSLTPSAGGPSKTVEKQDEVGVASSPAHKTGVSAENKPDSQNEKSNPAKTAIVVGGGKSPMLMGLLETRKTVCGDEASKDAVPEESNSVRSTPTDTATVEESVKTTEKGEQESERGQTEKVEPIEVAQNAGREEDEEKQEHNQVDEKDTEKGILSEQTGEMGQGDVEVAPVAETGEKEIESDLVCDEVIPKSVSTRDSSTSLDVPTGDNAISTGESSDTTERESLKGATAETNGKPEEMEKPLPTAAAPVEMTQRETTGSKEMGVATGDSEKVGVALLSTGESKEVGVALPVSQKIGVAPQNVDDSRVKMDSRKRPNSADSALPPSPKRAHLSPSHTSNPVPISNPTPALTSTSHTSPTPQTLPITTGTTVTPPLPPQTLPITTGTTVTPPLPPQTLPITTGTTVTPPLPPQTLPITTGTTVTPPLPPQTLPITTGTTVTPPLPAQSLPLTTSTNTTSKIPGPPPLILASPTSGHTPSNGVRSSSKEAIERKRDREVTRGSFYHHVVEPGALLGRVGGVTIQPFLPSSLPLPSVCVPLHTTYAMPTFSPAMGPSRTVLAAPSPLTISTSSHHHQSHTSPITHPLSTPSNITSLSTTPILQTTPTSSSLMQHSYPGNDLITMSSSSDEALIRELCSEATETTTAAALASQLGLEFLEPNLLGGLDLMQLVHSPLDEVGPFLSGSESLLPDITPGGEGVPDTTHLLSEALTTLSNPSTPLIPSSLPTFQPLPLFPVVLTESPMELTRFHDTTPSVAAPLFLHSSPFSPHTPTIITPHTPSLSSPLTPEILPDIENLASANEADILEGIPPELAETIQALAQFESPL